MAKELEETSPASSRRFSFRGSSVYAAERAFLITLAQMPAGRRSSYIRDLIVMAHRIHGDVVNPSGISRDVSPSLDLTDKPAGSQRIYFWLSAASLDESALIAHLMGCPVGRRPVLIRALVLEGFRLEEEATKSVGRSINASRSGSLGQVAGVSVLNRRASDRLVVLESANSMATKKRGRPRKIHTGDAGTDQQPNAGRSPRKPQPAITAIEAPLQASAHPDLGNTITPLPVTTINEGDRSLLQPSTRDPRLALLGGLIGFKPR